LLLAGISPSKKFKQPFENRNPQILPSLFIARNRTIALFKLAGFIAVLGPRDTECRSSPLVADSPSLNAPFLPGEQTMGRPVVHFEIGCRDAQKTQDFYGKLFDWKIQSMGPAAMIAPDPSGIGGHICTLGHEPHNYTIFYVDVDAVAAYLKKAEALGGKTLVPLVNIPTGTFAWMQDPEGNTVGLWKAKV
jgi:uncharacterized protein